MPDDTPSRPTLADFFAALERELREITLIAAAVRARADAEDSVVVPSVAPPLVRLAA